MYKNQLQELAQHCCFNLPSYACIHEGPAHALRFKATVNFNGETFESPSFFSTLRQAEHAAAEVALSTLANRGPSKILAAKVLDETGVYKNLLQETAHSVGVNLPVYTTVRSGPEHIPIFSCTVQLAGRTFTGEPSKTKKQAEKNAAMAAWSDLKQMSQHGSSSSSPATSECHEGQEQLEALVRNLEGKELGRSAESANGKPKIEVYDKDHKNGALITPAKTYNPAADSIIGKEEKVVPMELEVNDTDSKRRRKRIPLLCRRLSLPMGMLMRVRRRPRRRRIKQAENNDKVEATGEKEKKKKSKNAEAEEVAEPVSDKKEKKKKKKNDD